MAVRSVYVPQPAIETGRLRITGEAHKHLSVARAEHAEVVEIFDGTGNVWTANVDSIGKSETIVRITSLRTIQRDPAELIVALAMFRTSAYEFALEKIAEVGISRVIPFSADRSNAQAGNRHERWERILIEAVKQSKQYFVPMLERPVSFNQVLGVPAASKIMFAERDGGPLKSALSGSPVLCLVGPEGGWTDRESIRARENGFRSVSLGAAILKAETAAIVGTSLIRYELAR